MFTPQAIGSMDSPYKDPAAIPKGLGAKHHAEDILRILLNSKSVIWGLRPLPRLRSARHTPFRQSTPWHICPTIAAPSKSGKRSP
jgi:hypothetical protein